MNKAYIHKPVFIGLSDTESERQGSLSEVLPGDLKEVIGKKGHLFKDAFSKSALYCALSVEKSRVAHSMRSGLVLGTQYGNFENHARMIDEAGDSSTKLSAQLFPNATFGSASVLCSIATNSKGTNLTLSAGKSTGFESIKQAFKLVQSQKLDSVITLVGDDSSTFTNLSSLAENKLLLKPFMSALELSTSSKNVPFSFYLDKVKVFSSINSLLNAVPQFNENKVLWFYQDQKIDLSISEYFAKNDAKSCADKVNRELFFIDQIMSELASSKNKFGALITPLENGKFGYIQLGKHING
ncbi:beta-ketoacyl synthase N-terminal-like domain-containing protein [Pseudoalteromonas piscicida]|uniref:beta-ketoacyl synthase N-terminal-like domain-containing protein n=1 Tax=Pseudoalteromonas piscicida TaxID=43662 RepID=UPI001246852A|nr:beta-ketoacyl synthase N-terminal-like domain-containing protein [Pseudoalteromonas piscicida]